MIAGYNAHMANADEPTATDERAAQNRDGAPIVPLSRHDDDPSIDPKTGVPAGMHDTDANPLDNPDQN